MMDQPAALAEDGASGVNAIAYEGIFRIFRNTVVAHIRARLQAAYGAAWEDALRRPFQREWDLMVERADGARRSGLIEGAPRDAADYLSVNHFYNLFDAQYAKLWPEFDGDAETKTAILHWARGIKLARDFVAHPVDLDLSFSDAFVLLDAARRILAKVDLPASARVSDLQTRLLGEGESHGAALAEDLPPRDDVVLDFIGRRSLLADLHRWFGDPHGRRWLLAGADGGRGKSALAYEFATQIQRYRPKHLALVAWLSAKERQFQEGQTVSVTPDFTDLESAIDRLLAAYGVQATGALEERRDQLLALMSDLPALVVVDDVDSLSGRGEQAIEFFTIDVGSTRSKVLFTARRVPLGLGATVTHVGPFEDDEAREFIASRMRLFQIEPGRLTAEVVAEIMQLTDRSALYLEDLLRLCRNLSPADAMRGWTKNRGAKVREYALRREVELLTPLARKLLIACGLASAPISLGELQVAANVTTDEVIDALTELGTFYLVPQPRLIEDQPRYSLNSNTKRLIREVYGKSPEGRAAQAALDHAFGPGAAPEDEQEAMSICRHAVVLLSADRHEDAASLLTTALDAGFPDHPRILAQLGWVYKKWSPTRLDEARVRYERAYLMNNRNPDTYWHWADMEMHAGNWQAEYEAAMKGIERCGDDPGLYLMAADAVNRLAYDLRQQLHTERAAQEHGKALALYEKALDASRRLSTGPDVLSRIYAGLARVTRATGQRVQRERYLQMWRQAMPDDWRLSGEGAR